jgi:ABC-type branched-subunit amino acid transport system substrate-binding protein
VSRAGRCVAVAAIAALALGACTGSKKEAKKAEEVKLRIGVLFTTGGQGGDLASAVLGSAKLAADAAAKNKVKIETVEADYAGDIKRVPSALAALRDKVDAVVVGTDDPAVLPQLAALESVPIVHAFITADAAIGDATNVFRVAPTNQMQASSIARFLTEKRKYAKVGIVSDDTAFGREGLADLQGALAAVGVTPDPVVTFTPGGDIHTPVARLGGRGVDAAIVWVASPGEAARIVVETHRMEFAYQIVLSGNLATLTFAKNASSQVTPVAFREGMLSVGTWAGPWFTLPRIVDFFTEFQKQNSALAPVQAASVYDAFLALASAAQDGSSAAASDLVEGLEKLRDFEGAGVPVTFGSGKHEGLDADDMALLAFTKEQASAGGDFAPDVDTGGGFFTIVASSLALPPKYAFLTAHS